MSTLWMSGAGAGAGAGDLSVGGVAAKEASPAGGTSALVVPLAGAPGTAQVVALGGTLNFVRAVQAAQQGLGVEQLLQTAAQHRPVILGERKVSPQIEDGDLTYLASDALAAYQAMRVVALAGDFVVGAGLTNEHVCHASGKTGEKPRTIKILWHNKMQFRATQNQRLYKSMGYKATDPGKGVITRNLR